MKYRVEWRDRSGTWQTPGPADDCVFASRLKAMNAIASLRELPAGEGWRDTEFRVVQVSS